MLAEIIRELTKCDESTTIHSENVLTWGKIVKAKNDQTVVISSLHKTKALIQWYKKM